MGMHRAGVCMRGDLERCWSGQSRGYVNIWDVETNEDIHTLDLLDIVFTSVVGHSARAGRR
jgi:hypothetical protein